MMKTTHYFRWWYRPSRAINNRWSLGFIFHRHIMNGYRAVHNLGIRIVMSPPLRFHWWSDIYYPALVLNIGVFTIVISLWRRTY